MPLPEVEAVALERLLRVMEGALRVILPPLPELEMDVLVLSCA